MPKNSVSFSAYQTNYVFSHLTMDIMFNYVLTPEEVGLSCHCVCFCLSAGAVATATKDEIVRENHKLDVGSLSALRSGPDLLGERGGVT